MSKLDNNSLVFMADLLDCMLDDINITLITESDPEKVKLLSNIKTRITSAFIMLNNFNTIRGYNV